MSIPRLITFLTIAMSVYFGMHYWVYRNLSVLTDGRAWFKWVFILLALTFPAVQIISHTCPFCPGVWVTRLAAFWLGLIFMLFLWFFFAWLLRTIVGLIPGLPEMHKKYWVLTVTLLVFGMAAWGMIQGLRPPRTVRYTIDRREHFGLDRSLRIVQLSDMHLGSSLGTDFLRDVINRTEELNPDLILITGDLVDMDLRNFKTMTPLLRELKAPMGTFAVTGNHEYISSVHGFLETMRQAGIPVLQNQLVHLETGLQLAGVNDLSANQMSPRHKGSDVNFALKNYDPSYPCILMSHQPAGLDTAVAKGVDLILSGHTHSGQVFPFHLFVRMAFKYITGNHQLGPKTNLIISNGTGFWGPPMRLMAPAQIVLVEFLY